MSYNKETCGCWIDHTSNRLIPCSDHAEISARSERKEERAAAQEAARDSIPEPDEVKNLVEEVTG